MENQTFDNNKALLSDDELVAMFFEESRQELADDGFSQRVMQRLPSRAVRISRIWTLLCVLVGTVFFIKIDGLAQLKQVLTNSVGNFWGFLSSVDFSGLSPMMILVSLLLLASFVGWNLVADYSSRI